MQISYESHFDTSLVWSRLAIFVKKVARNHELPSIGSGKVAKESRERSRYDLARLEPARHVTWALISSDGRDTSLSTDFQAILSPIIYLFIKDCCKNYQWIYSNQTRRAHILIISSNIKFHSTNSTKQV